MMTSTPSTAQHQPSVASEQEKTPAAATATQPQQTVAPQSAPSATPGTITASNNSINVSPPEPATNDSSDKTKAKDKAKKRGIFGFGRKKEEKQESKPPVAAPTTSSSNKAPAVSSTTMASSRGSPPAQLEQHPYKTPCSPGRALSASSPRVVSPAGSQIFERDVQESQHTLPNSPAIPNHISTENYIPPVLDASSEAITDDHLSPEAVEIVTHTTHQPAAASLSGMPSMDNLSSAWEQDLQSLNEKDDAASNYGSLDSTDVRRLSFISFADVVQAEQATHNAGQPGSRDSVHLAGLTSLSSMSMNRSSSPMRSPVSSPGLGTSPPTSKSGSVKGLEMSPARKPIGSPTSTYHALPPIGSEVNIETMAQALRRTGSTDLSHVRSMPASPIEGPSR